jgi:lipoate-protein ligase A
MKFLTLETTNPYRNLAIEEYLFLHSEDDVLLLWQNEPTVVIGKNQNAYAELDLDAIRARGVHVARRITGGGAVYHDLGNVNYSLISTTRGREGLNFAAFCAPMIKALADLGVPAEMSGRNDLLVDGKKISGNAQHASVDRVLHHVTLLFDSDLDALSAVLRVDEEKLRAKAVRSVPSRVTNIRPYLGEDCDVRDFIARLGESLCRLFGATPLSLPTDAEIDSLCARNASEEWIFPERALLSQYSLIKKKRYSFGTVEVLLDMQNEIVRNAHIRGDFFGTRPIAELEARLQGRTLSEASEEILNVTVEDYIFGMSAEALAALLQG